MIEELLEGPEISVLAFSDGYTIVPLPPAQDHKRIGEGDTGLNTGGMGAYAPAPVATPAIMDRIMRETLRPTIDGMRKEGMSVNLALAEHPVHHSSTRFPIRWSPFCRIDAYRKGTKIIGIQRPIRRSRDRGSHSSTERRRGPRCSTPRTSSRFTRPRNAN